MAYGRVVDEQPPAPRPLDDVGFEAVDPASADAQWAMRRYVEELDRTFPGGFPVEATLAEAIDVFVPPGGVFVVARAGDRVVGCGGVQFLDATTGEIKRMWVHPDARGSGLGRRLLAHLEGRIAGAGRSRVLLDTNGTLAPAIAMYRAAGYLDRDRYNDNPYAEHWFEKDLDPSINLPR